jgi:thiamine pyrophosphokinase
MMENTRILIFTGGQLGEWALEEMNSDDFIIGVDRGALFLIQHGITPQRAIGDFDSVSKEEFSLLESKITTVISCDPIMKDLTDTEMALNWSLEQEPREIVLLGATGSRFDHTLANVHLLYKGLKAGITCRIIDKNNEIRLINRSATLTKTHFTHVSLLPLSSEVTGITLHGFLYPLRQARLTIGQSLGISNILQEKTGTIELTSGELLVIQSMD